MEAATINIYEDGTGDFPTIQAAIDNSGTTTGDVIIVHDGTYAENINFLGKAITVKSENGPDYTTIDGNHTFKPPFSTLDWYHFRPPFTRTIDRFLKCQYNAKLSSVLLKVC